RVRPARPPGEPAGARVHPRGAPRRGVGVPRRFGRPHRRLARARAATQARQRRRAHRPRRGVRGGNHDRRGTIVTRRERLRHPLDDSPSIKPKLGFVIAAAVAVTVFVFWVLIKIGVWPSVSGIIAAALAMTIVWFLSRGMTSPLRDMAAAASEMAKGNY